MPSKVPGLVWFNWCALSKVPGIDIPGKPTAIQNKPQTNHKQSHKSYNMSFIWKQQQEEERKKEHPRKRASALGLLTKVAGFCIVLKVLPYIIDVVEPLFDSAAPSTPPSTLLPTPHPTPSV